MRQGKTLRVAALALGMNALLATPALAYEFPRKLAPGDAGRPVKVLQVRLAGWFPAEGREHFELDGHYGNQTARAVRAFEEFHGIPADEVAGPRTFALINRLQDPDGSTAHFDFSEFTQNRSSSCGAQANAYAGSFAGGPVSPRRTRRNIRRLMWRLEALRARGGGNQIGINSGFRSRAYNDCIGGASASQHLYGTAADNRMSRVTNRRERALARRAQFHGVACYSNTTHNHLDLRIDNHKLPSAQFWYWPRRDRYGRELADNGLPCWGETTRTAATASVLQAVARAVPGAGSMVPSVAEIEAFQEAGEPEDLGFAD